MEEGSLKIPTVEHGWEYDEVRCPPDRDFIEYLSMQPTRAKPVVIFHLGPGLHHKVGLWAATQKNIYVRAMSITPEEVMEYIRLASENPLLNSRYQVDFGDIHLLNTCVLPRMDYITLFHLGEISAQANDPAYGGTSISDIVSMMTRRLSLQGEILFYENSVAWKDIKAAVEVNLSYRYEYTRSTFKSLTIFKKTRP
jgi:hypothetical protein